VVVIAGCEQLKQ